MPATLDHLRGAHPAGGLFAGKRWLESPEPFPLPAKLLGELKRLGHRLHVFQRACDDLYFQSLKGRQPEWIAGYLDRGKPAELLEAARDRSQRQELPGVIRPDLILTDSGFVLTEIDSVPGGIGLTGWLNETYAAAGYDVVGGAKGMLEGFASVFPDGADIVISRESADYRPEMDWLAARMREHFSVHSAESHQPRRDIYRFFELFDLPNIASWKAMAAHARAGHALNAPLKPWLEEKLWLALFWSRPLRQAWRQALRDNHRDELLRIIPRTWIVDPAPVPHHAVIPGLDINRWEELSGFSQKERQLVLKISGFSDLAWGSRSVVVGHDVSQAEWSQALAGALRSFETNPYILQEFHRGAIVLHPYFDADTGAIREMQGRVRLCPYYFVPRDGGRVALGGVLATIVPADKKIIHGMRDGIVVPCCLGA
jgi:hypothetical protein